MIGAAERRDFQKLDPGFGGSVRSPAVERLPPAGKRRCPMAALATEGRVQAQGAAGAATVAGLVLTDPTN